MELPESSPASFGTVPPGTYKRGEDLPFTRDEKRQYTRDFCFYAAGYHLVDEAGRVATWARDDLSRGPILFKSRAAAMEFRQKVAGSKWWARRNGELIHLLQAWGAGRYCWLSFGNGRLGFVDFGANK